MKPVASTTVSAISPATQLEAFIVKFEPATARLIRECRAELRTLLPTAVELVYDNYNFFVIGYCSTERPSHCILSLAVAANGVGLSFYCGASLPDPEHLLLGSGKQNRFVRLPSVETLRPPESWRSSALPWHWPSRRFPPKAVAIPSYSRSRQSSVHGASPKARANSYRVAESCTPLDSGVRPRTQSGTLRIVVTTPGRPT